MAHVRRVRPKKKNPLPSLALRFQLLFDCWIELSHSTASSSEECWNSARQPRFTEDLPTRKQRKWRDTSMGILTVSLCLSWCKAKMQNDNDFQHSATFFSLPGYHSSSDNVTTKSISRKLTRTISKVLKDTELTRCSRLLLEKRW